MATGHGEEQSGQPHEMGASAKDFDYLHIIDWKVTEQVVAAGNTVERDGVRVIALDVAAAQGDGVGSSALIRV